MADTTDVQADEVPVSNVGYAAVPDGFVFIPTTTGDGEVLRKLFDAVDNPEDVITRAGYGYVVPEAAAAKAGLESEKVVQVIDPSTPDTTPAENGLDTQDSPITTANDDEIAAATEGPLNLASDDPARHPDDEPAQENPADDETPGEAPVQPGDAPLDESGATDAEAEGADAPAADAPPADQTPAPAGKKGSAAAAAS